MRPAPLVPRGRASCGDGSSSRAGKGSLDQCPFSNTPTTRVTRTAARSDGSSKVYAQYSNIKMQVRRSTTHSSLVIIFECIADTASQGHCVDRAGSYRGVKTRGKSRGLMIRGALFPPRLDLSPTVLQRSRTVARPTFELEKRLFREPPQKKSRDFICTRYPFFVPNF